MGGLSMGNFIDLFFNLDIMGQAWPLLLKGLIITLELCLYI